MKIEAVDFFYLSMPEVTTEADASQDALLVWVRAGGHVGWGECEASPLAPIAAFVCPMSHRPLGESVLGAPLNDPADIARISARAPGFTDPNLVASGLTDFLAELFGAQRGA